MISAVVVGVLWLLTIVASDAPWEIITAFWVIVWGVLALWVRNDQRRSGIDTMAPGLESALRRNEADVYDFRSTSFVEFEEIEDEGACYAFALDDDRVVFVSGQEFYPEARFPSHDFSLAYILDERGHTVDMLIEKRGPKAAPARVIAGSVKETLVMPDHLETRTMRIADLEEALRAYPS